MIITYERDLETYLAKGNRIAAAGDTVFEAISAWLTQLREDLFDEYLTFLANNGSSPKDVVYTDEGAAYISVGEDGEEQSFPLPEKYHDFI